MEKKILKVTNEVKDAEDMKLFALKCRKMYDDYTSDLKKFEENEITTFPLISASGKFQYETEDDYQVSILKSVLEFLKRKKVLVQTHIDIA